MIEGCNELNQATKLVIPMCTTLLYRTVEHGVAKRLESASTKANVASNATIRGNAGAGSDVTAEATAVYTVCLLYTSDAADD